MQKQRTQERSSSWRLGRDVSCTEKRRDWRNPPNASGAPFAGPPRRELRPQNSDEELRSAEKRRRIAQLQLEAKQLEMRAAGKTPELSVLTDQEAAYFGSCSVSSVEAYFRSIYKSYTVKTYIFQTMHSTFLL